MENEDKKPKKVKAAKEKLAKTPKKAAAAQPNKIALKKVGKNFIGTIDGETFSAVITDEKTVDTLKQKVAAYNLKNSEATKKQIIKILTPKEAAKKEEKEKLETKEKGLKKLAKKKEKESAEAKDTVAEDRKLVVSDIEKAIASEEMTVKEVEEMLKKFKKVEEKEKVAAPVSTGYRRSGEY